MTYDTRVRQIQFGYNGLRAMPTCKDFLQVRRSGLLRTEPTVSALREPAAIASDLHWPACALGMAVLLIGLVAEFVL